MASSKLSFFIGALVFALCASQIAAAGDFVWGTATAAYQIEGAWNIDGKGLNIWDVYTSYPGVVYHNQTGQIADDFYHHFQEDIATMAKLKIKHFRMSIAWSRVLPNGTIDFVNQKGVDFYNNVFNLLLANGIQPWVTLYHWDLPAALNDKTETGGWLNPDIVNKFNDYADFCFKTFGDRVKHWITLNEIQEFTWGGYGGGGQAPGRCSPSYQAFCKEVGGGGNSATEPYIAAHHALLCHGIAVQTYRAKYQATQGGQIGITIDSSYAEPFDPNNPEDVKAVDTYLSFKYGWLADPIVFGKYPDIMTQYVTDNRLPTFTDAQAAMMKGSFDFLGLNHYTTRYVQHTGEIGTDYSNDYRLRESITDVNGHQIGPLAGNGWLYVYPQGMRKIVNWIAKRYGNPPLYIFENGTPCPNESVIPRELAVKDTFRVNYLKNYIGNMIEAKVTDKVNMAGYFVWSTMDNFEWGDGYSVRFGLTYIDYNNNNTRYLKDSAYFYSTIIQATEPISEIKTEQDVEDNLAHLFSITERF
jgi:beta-glucosidase